MTPATRVLLAEDSPFLVRLLTSYLDQAGGFQVVGTALNGREAIERYRELRPDVVALDLMMPDVDGVEVLREIIAHRPVPVVVITGASGMDAVLTLRALEAGASDFVMKFDPQVPKSPEAVRAEIVAKMRRAARKALRDADFPATAALAAPQPAPSKRDGITLPSLVVIGASTGGPAALRQLVAELPDTFPGAIVIVQHVPAAFSSRMAADLCRFSRLPAAELSESERLLPGTIRIAPGGLHLIFEANRRVSFRAYNGEANCPSIDLAMESAANVYGANAVGLILTGMGTDGAHGLNIIRQRGGRTMVQDPASCVVAGMTMAALATGSADFIGPPIALGQRLAQLITIDNGGTRAY
jgi:two-component system, chemotaxis family, protein-glutamate methylesterase/glutaminase